MKLIKTNWDIPYYNFALEDYLLNSTTHNDDYFFFYIHKPSLIVGRHQNTYSEINYEFIKRNNICVARRISGGGCVYHDKGNLNFSYILNRNNNEALNFKKYCEPILNALNSMGISATLSGRNDLIIDGKKFSGNAEYVNKTKILHHGTIMYDVDIEYLVNAINVSAEKIQSKSIKSIKSRVVNLIDYMPTKISIEEFKGVLLSQLFKENDIQIYELTQKDISKVKQIATEKFMPTSFNFGNKLEFIYTNSKKFDAGIIEIGININQNKITEMKISGDFFSNLECAELEKLFIDCNYFYEDIKNIIDDINVDDYISNLKNEELLEVIFF